VEYWQEEVKDDYATFAMAWLCHMVISFMVMLDLFLCSVTSVMFIHSYMNVQGIYTRFTKVLTKH
jgi:hypothetical protein